MCCWITCCWQESSTPSSARIYCLLMDSCRCRRAAHADGGKLLGLQYRKQPQGAGSDDPVCARAGTVTRANRLHDVFPSGGRSVGGGVKERCWFSDVGAGLKPAPANSRLI